MPLEYVRITPIDVLYLRGNRLFSEAGHAEPVMPPWPSLFAGALRSRMLVERPEDEAAFRDRRLEGTLGEVIGRGPSELGSFRLAVACLELDGRRVYPLPADLVVLDDGDSLTVHRLRPIPVNEPGAVGVVGTFPLPRAPILAVPEQRKPLSGYWLREEGLLAWQRGDCPGGDVVVHQRNLWADDPRLGIALDGERRTAKESMLYTTATISLSPGVRFFVAVAGAGGHLPQDGLVRLGGDGRGAAVEAWQPSAGEELPWQRTPRSDRFTMMMATPCVSPGGWLPPGTRVEGGEHVWSVQGCRARIVAAAVARPQIISGWDLAQRKPKPALRAIPAGSVYWMERLDGELGALAHVLEHGLWDDEAHDPARRAEGFNNVWFGEWRDSPVKEA